MVQHRNISNTSNTRSENLKNDHQYGQVSSVLFFFLVGGGVSGSFRGWRREDLSERLRRCATPLDALHRPLLVDVVDAAQVDDAPVGDGLRFDLPRAAHLVGRLLLLREQQTKGTALFQHWPRTVSPRRGCWKTISPDLRRSAYNNNGTGR